MSRVSPIRRPLTRAVEWIVDDELAIELMMDMQLYELVPRLQPLKLEALQIHSKIRRLSRDAPLDQKYVRQWYIELADKFFRFIDAIVREGHQADLAPIKELLAERHKLRVQRLVFPCPVAGRIEV